jgi:hypothetical protein
VIFFTHTHHADFYIILAFMRTLYNLDKVKLPETELSLKTLIPNHCQLLGD